MDKINYIYSMKSYHTQKVITYKKAVHLRYLSANIKIEDKNGNLKMQINNKKSRKTTEQIVQSFLLERKQKMSNLGKTIFSITIAAIS